MFYLIKSNITRIEAEEQQGQENAVFQFVSFRLMR
jgi:hypothetical protein